MKRIFDFSCSFAGLVVLSPVLFIFMFLIWLQDFHSPFYIAPRVGKNGRPFNMVKLRSMIIGADKSGVDSTAANDRRITRVGHIIRRFKLDEFCQLWNVFLGHMSMVGPRPNVQRDVDLYTDEERHLLDVQPGITDFSSIVFSDEGEILEGAEEPDLRYNQLIRPWKSRLGLFYIGTHTIMVDFKLIILTITAIVSRKNALAGAQLLLRQLGADEQLISVAGRKEELRPYPPPGSDEIVVSRNL